MGGCPLDQAENVLTASSVAGSAIVRPTQIVTYDSSFLRLSITAICIFCLRLLAQLSRRLGLFLTNVIQTWSLDGLQFGDIVQFETVFWEPDDTLTREKICEEQIAAGRKVLEIGTGTAAGFSVCKTAPIAWLRRTSIPPQSPMRGTTRRCWRPTWIWKCGK